MGVASGIAAALFPPVAPLVYGVEKSTEAAEKAAEAQAGAAQRAGDIQMQMFQQARADIRPWREAGARALGRLEELIARERPGIPTLPEAPTAPTPQEIAERMALDPGYRFRLQEGMDAVKSAMARSGLLGSGATLKGLTRYAQDYASGEFGQAYGREQEAYRNALAKYASDYGRAMDIYNLQAADYYNALAPYQSLAGIGQTTAAQMGRLGQTASQGIANALMAAGAARAEGIAGRARAITEPISDIYRNIFSLAGAVL